MIYRGEIYWVQLDPTVGGEIQKTRPCLVISNNQSNHHSTVITVIPITSKVLSRIYPFEVAIDAGVGGLKKAGLIKINQIKTVDKLRISGKPLGNLVEPIVLKQVAEAIKIHLDILS